VPAAGFDAIVETHGDRRASSLRQTNKQLAKQTNSPLARGCNAFSLLTVSYPTDCWAKLRIQSALISSVTCTI
jgi:hypothetical protein